MTTGSLQVNHFFRASSDDSESWFSCALICYGWHGKLGSVLKFPWCEDCVDILFLDSNAGRLVTRVRSTVIIVGKWFWFQICENPVSNLNCIFFRWIIQPPKSDSLKSNHHNFSSNHVMLGSPPFLFQLHFNGSRFFYPNLRRSKGHIISFTFLGSSLLWWTLYPMKLAILPFASWSAWQAWWHQKHGSSAWRVGKGCLYIWPFV